MTFACQKVTFGVTFRVDFGGDPESHLLVTFELLLVFRGFRGSRRSAASQLLVQKEAPQRRLRVGRTRGRKENLRGGGPTTSEGYMFALLQAIPLADSLGGSDSRAAQRVSQGSILGRLCSASGFAPPPLSSTQRASHMGERSYGPTPFSRVLGREKLEHMPSLQDLSALFLAILNRCNLN